MRKIFDHGPAAGLLGVMSSCVVFGLWVLLPNLLGIWELSTYDARLRLIGQPSASPELVIIGRDPRSDAQFGYGIWDRAVFGRLLQSLKEAGAKVVALDFHFSGESPPGRGGAVSDVALVEATKKAGNVFYPIAVRLTAALPTLGSEPQTSVSLQAILDHDSTKVSPETIEKIPKATLLNGVIPTLIQHARGIGHMAAMSDADGVFRRVPSYLNIQGHLVPAFGVVIAASFLGVPPERIKLRPGEALIFEEAMSPDGTFHTTTIPIDQKGQFWINFAGRWNEAPFHYVSFIDVWDAIKEKRTNEIRDLVKGKIILVIHGALEADKRRTPFELKAPGGFIHANVIHTILNRNTLWEPGALARSCLTLFLASFASWCIFIFPSLRGMFSVVGLSLIYLAIIQMMLTHTGIVLPLLSPIFAMALAASGSFAWKMWRSQRLVEKLGNEIIEHQAALTSAREAATKFESAVEQLEEDLEMARKEAQASTDKKEDLVQKTKELISQLDVARAQHETSREEVSRLKRKITNLREAEIHPVKLSHTTLERLAQECSQMGILTQAPGVVGAFKDLKKAAQSPTPILLLGEPGTGKELFAQAAHQLGPRAHEPFVIVNMAAIPADLFESELFGHAKGAFTGAARDHKGYFEQAHKGTIFLDEIGDLRLDMQGKLLRVLQEGTFYRVGAATPTKVDVRIIAATNKDLTEGVASNWFREDLYFRLKGIEIRLLPLRERKEDIALLAEQFVRVMAHHTKKESPAFSRGAVEALRKWPWPGNVRELKQCVDQAIILLEDNLITERDLRLEAGNLLPSKNSSQGETSNQDVTGDTALLAHLQQYGFDMQATAQAVGWDRSTVTQRLKGMCFRALVEHDGNRHAAAEELAGCSALVRVVELKLSGYFDHLLNVVREQPTEDESIAVCQKRFKTLPDRYLPDMETLIRRFYTSRN